MKIFRVIIYFEALENILQIFGKEIFMLSENRRKSDLSSSLTYDKKKIKCMNNGYYSLIYCGLADLTT